MPTVLSSGRIDSSSSQSTATNHPHIHIRREKMVAKLRLDPIALEKAGGFSRSELNRLARLVEENQTRLLEAWYEYFGS